MVESRRVMVNADSGSVEREALCCTAADWLAAIARSGPPRNAFHQAEIFCPPRN